jgi:hypothetical protein
MKNWGRKCYLWQKVMPKFLTARTETRNQTQAIRTEYTTDILVTRLREILIRIRILGSEHWIMALPEFVHLFSRQ